jgi:hypothetical protein
VGEQVLVPSVQKIFWSRCEFGSPVNNHLVTIDIYFIFNIIQLKSKKFPMAPIFSFFKGFVCQKIVQNVPDFFKSKVIVGNDAKKQILVVERVNLHIFLPVSRRKFGLILTKNQPFFKAFFDFELIKRKPIEGFRDKLEFDFVRKMRDK